MGEVIVFNREAKRGKPTAEGPRHDVMLGYLAGNSITSSFHQSLLDLIGYDLSGPTRLRKWTQARTGPLGLPDTRNAVCKQTLEDPDCQWLFMVDSDMGFESDSLERLLMVADPDKRPVMGGLCFAMRELGPDGMSGYVTAPNPTILTWTDKQTGVLQFVGRDHYPVNSPIQVGATGAAFLLIHRSALERIGGDWFTQKPANDGQMQGEDISFCDRCRELEIPVWVHTGIRTTHMKTVWVAESDFWRNRAAEPATEHADVLIPTLGGRPDNIPRLMRSLRASTGLATAWYICDPEDDETRRLATQEGAEVLLQPEQTNYSRALNWAYKAIWTHDGDRPKPSWILMGADDISFQPGWLDHAQEVAKRWDANVVATNDLLNPRVARGEHATHPLIRCSYIDEVGASWDGPGLIAHEGYEHHYLDDEITWAAKLRGTFQAALGSYVPHHHPISGKVAVDAVYQKHTATMEADKRIFDRRLAKALAGR